MPALEREPAAPGRIDAGIARAEAPRWHAGNLWRYRGKTFDHRNNRTFARVVRESELGGRPVYEVQRANDLLYVNRETLNGIQRRSESGEVTVLSAAGVPFHFPFSVGAHWSSTGKRTDDEGNVAPLHRTCAVLNYEDVTVHAGTFAAFRIDCDGKDGFEQAWYAPSAQNWVKVRTLFGHDSFESELWEYELKNPAP